VIGSGATAVTIVPAIAERAAHVTMLQRSPTYFLARPEADKLADWLRAKLPAGLAHRVIRGRNATLGLAFYQFCRRFPKAAARLLRGQIAKLLPADYPMQRDFTPRYDPWDERLCVVPEGDFFKAMRSGKASVVTDTIAEVTASGIRTTGGQQLDAELIVTATGLELLPWGGIALSVDGRGLAPGETLVYKGMMLAGVPNLAWCVGYTNASWTLRADLSSRNVCRLLNHMARRGYTHVTPIAGPDDQGRRPVLDLASGYVQRAAGNLPQQGTRAPWYLRQNYLLDWGSTTFGRVTDRALRFSR
ncbi:MAG TPA: NAD(P)/FAD-dependent oxidoreductase, partial [Kofleriaceae bacterium]